MKKRVIALILMITLLFFVIPILAASTDTAVMTSSEFITCLKKALARSTTYNNSYPYNLGYYNGSTISWDCWNLGKSIIWSGGSIVDNYTVGQYARVNTSCGLGDWDGLTIIKKAPNCNGDFSNLIPGEWLYMEGHIGYYIGDGQVIECTTGWGANGVVQSQISSTGVRSKNGVRNGSWIYHGMVPWIDYTAYLDVNGWLDGQSVSNISGYGTCDVYVNGQRVANDCSDYYTDHQVGASYEIKDIRPAAGYSYDGIHSGSRTGSVSSGGTNVVLQFSKIRLADVTASPQIGYYGGHTYYYYSTPVTVYTAKAFCESKGGHLVFLSDSAEDTYVKSLFPTGTSVWIGATDESSEGTWKWNDGSAMNYSRWNDGEPNNSHGDLADSENFAHYTSNGYWNDTNGCQKYGFVCEIDSCKHTLTHYAEVASSCTEEGTKEHWTCSACNRLFADANANTELSESAIVLSMTGHSFEKGICTVCGEIDESILKGDINLDGVVSSADAVLLAKYLIGTAQLNEAQSYAADLNNDRLVTSADAVLLAQNLIS